MLFRSVRPLHPQIHFIQQDDVGIAQRPQLPVDSSLLVRVQRPASQRRLPEPVGIGKSEPYVIEIEAPFNVPACDANNRPDRVHFFVFRRALSEAEEGDLVRLIDSENCWEQDCERRAFRPRIESAPA